MKIRVAYFTKNVIPAAISLGSPTFHPNLPGSSLNVEGKRLGCSLHACIESILRCDPGFEETTNLGFVNEPRKVDRQRNGSKSVIQRSRYRYGVDSIFE